MVQRIQHVHTKLEFGVFREEGFGQSWNREVFGDSHIEVDRSGLRHAKVDHVARLCIASCQHIRKTAATGQRCRRRRNNRTGIAVSIPYARGYAAKTPEVM